MPTVECDVAVIGSGAAALTAALRAARHGLSVVILEKAHVVGGTSAMSGGAIWAPGNPLASARGHDDGVDDIVAYLRATLPAAFAKTENERWEALARNAGPMISFVIGNTPVKFELIDEPDYYAEAPGAKNWRIVSALPISRWRAGRWTFRIRPSTLPQNFTYAETHYTDLYRRPARAVLLHLHRLVWRFITRSSAKGSGLIVGLLNGCERAGCKLFASTAARELIFDENTQGVAGLRAAGPDGELSFRTRKGVVLACGGFEWDEARFNKHFPGSTDFMCSPRTNTGDAIRMAEPLGAALDHMEEISITSAVPTRYEGHVHGMPMPFHSEPNVVMVDGTGRRFMSEYAYDFSAQLNARDEKTGRLRHHPVWLISDETMPRPLLRWFARYKPGWLVYACDVAELARKTKLPEAQLRETLDRFNESCRRGRDEEFQRGERNEEKLRAQKRGGVFKPIGGKLVAISFNRSVLGTKGGLKTNAEGAVVREDGTAIKGLYAAGLSAASCIGTTKIAQGGSLGPNMTWGFICGDAISRN